jgi:hypothetical protein
MSMGKKNKGRVEGTRKHGENIFEKIVYLFEKERKVK